MAAMAVNLAAFWLALHFEQSVPAFAKRPIVSFVDGSEHEAVLLCVLPFGFVAYALTLALGHHLTRRGEHGFLDIACVNQRDAARQQRAFARRVYQGEAVRRNCSRCVTNADTSSAVGHSA